MDEFFKSARAHLFLKCLFAGISITMIYLTLATSMESNLFKEWNALGAIPWMRATLCDFYFNITILSAWVIYKEAHALRSILWILAFICLGSIASAFYVFLQLATLQEGEGIAQVLLRREV